MLRTLCIGWLLLLPGVAWAAGGHCHCQHGHHGSCSATVGGHNHGHSLGSKHVPRKYLPSDLHGMRQAQRALRDPCYWTQPWHGEYYHTGYGVPVALVVPPTAGIQTDYSWGVSGTRRAPLYRQFNRENPGAASGGGFLGTPKWPSDTAQFGVYPVRGPW